VKLKQYRISPGHYEVGDYTILWGGHSYWQVRDQFGDIIEDFKTLRQALSYAIALQTRSARHG